MNATNHKIIVLTFTFSITTLLALLVMLIISSCSTSTTTTAPESCESKVQRLKPESDRYQRKIFCSLLTDEEQKNIEALWDLEEKEE